MEAINKILGRIPILLIAAGYCGFIAFDYQEWLSKPESELGSKKSIVMTAKETRDTLKKKLKEAEVFENSLNEYKAKVTQLHLQLVNTKGKLSTEIDVPNFISMVSLEAKKLGLRIKKITPESEVKKEYYAEVPFTLDVRGAFVQVLVFFDRISRFNEIVRVNSFNFKPTGSNSTMYVELDGAIKLATYKYVSTKADEIAPKEEAGK